MSPCIHHKTFRKDARIERCGLPCEQEWVSGYRRSHRMRQNNADGESINPKRHNISYVFQDPSCISWHTILEDVTKGPLIKGMEKIRTDEIGRRCIKLVDMAGFENYYPRQLWGGMQQRVAIARAYSR